MGYLRDYDYDIFVSHAHEELDKEYAKDSRTWTRQVVDVLRYLIERDLRTTGDTRSLEIFYDENAVEFDRGLTDQLEEKIDRSAVFLAFVSKAYLSSRWCPMEAARYKRGSVRRWSHDPGKTGVFLIEREETERGDWLDAFKDAAGDALPACSVYRRKTAGTDSAFARPLAWPHATESDEAGELLDRLARLAGQISETLRELDSPLPPPRVEQVPSLKLSSAASPTVFVGYTPRENRNHRWALTERLSQQGLRVLPTKPIADYDSQADFERQVRSDLEASELAALLLSDTNGSYNMTTTQIDLAHQVGLKLVLWRPAELGFAALDDQAPGYHTYQKSAQDLLHRAEDCSIEILAQRIGERLSPQLQEPGNGLVPFDPDMPTILVYSGNLEGYRFVRSELEPALETVIERNRWHVIYPRFGIDSPTRLMAFYQENIAECDAVIVVHCQEDKEEVFNTINAMDCGQAAVERLDEMKEMGRDSVLGTIKRLGRGFRSSKPNGEFHVAVIDGPPRELGVDFGGNPPVFDCSTRRVTRNLEDWLERLHAHIAARKATSKRRVRP